MADLNLIRSLGTAVQYHKDEVVFMENAPGNNMYIVLKGEFNVYVNSFMDAPVFIATVGSGSFFGEMSVIDGWPRSATVIAAEDSVALAIGNDKFEILIEKCPDIADSILKTLYSRVESTSEAALVWGKHAPPPPTLSADNVKGKIKLMVALARHIRQINDLLE